jgi:hypothetical protein
VIHKTIAFVLFGLGVATLAAASPGCGGGDGCVTACENAQSGGCTPKSTDCSKECDALQKDADKAGCDSQYSSFTSCAAGAKACQKNSTACNTEGTAFFACFEAFCKKNPKDSACTSPPPTAFIY